MKIATVFCHAETTLSSYCISLLQALTNSGYQIQADKKNLRKSPIPPTIKVKQKFRADYESLLPPEQVRICMKGKTFSLITKEDFLWYTNLIKEGKSVTLKQICQLGNKNEKLISESIKNRVIQDVS